MPVVETAAIKGQGTAELIQAARQAASNKSMQHSHAFAPVIEDALARIGDQITDVVEPALRRWFSVKLFERDEKVLARFQFGQDKADKINAIISAVEDELDDDAESIITDARYTYIAAVVKKCVKKKRVGETASDKIDRIVTNRILALPIFAIIMGLVYYVSISTVGTFVTDWTNDVLFGEIIPPAVEGILMSLGVAGWLLMEPPYFPLPTSTATTPVPHSDE